MTEKRVPWNEEREKAIADELARIETAINEYMRIYCLANKRIEELRMGLKLIENTHPSVIAAMRKEGRI